MTHEQSIEAIGENLRRCADAFARALNDALGLGLRADASIERFHIAGESRTSRIIVSTSVSRPGAKP